MLITTIVLQLAQGKLKQNEHEQNAGTNTKNIKILRQGQEEITAANNKTYPCTLPFVV
jgi:hypothetical protein